MGLADRHKRQRVHLHRHPLGVLIVTPPVLSWLAEPQAIWRRRRISVALPLVGVLALAFGYTRTQEGERLRLLCLRQALCRVQIVVRPQNIRSMIVRPGELVAGTLSWQTMTRRK